MNAHKSCGICRKCCRRNHCIESDRGVMCRDYSEKGYSKKCERMAKEIMGLNERRNCGQEN